MPGLGGRGRAGGARPSSWSEVQTPQYRVRSRRPAGPWLWLGKSRFPRARVPHAFSRARPPAPAPAPGLPGPCRCSADISGAFLGLLSCAGGVGMCGGKVLRRFQAPASSTPTLSSLSTPRSASGPLAAPPPGQHPVPAPTAPRCPGRSRAPWGPDAPGACFSLSPRPVPREAGGGRAACVCRCVRVCTRVCLSSHQGTSGSGGFGKQLLVGGHLVPWQMRAGSCEPWVPPPQQGPQGGSLAGGSRQAGGGGAPGRGGGKGACCVRSRREVGGGRGGWPWSWAARGCPGSCSWRTGRAGRWVGTEGKEG